MASLQDTKVSSTSATRLYPGETRTVAAKPAKSPSIAERFTDTFSPSHLVQDAKDVAKAGESMLSKPIQALKSAIQSLKSMMLNSARYDDIHADEKQAEDDKRKKEDADAYTASVDAAATARRMERLAAQKSKS